MKRALYGRTATQPFRLENGISFSREADSTLFIVVSLAEIRVNNTSV
jgi:hypothetical protein